MANAVRACRPPAPGPLRRPADLEIKGFVETSFLDWDGKVVSALFVPFCNFRCPFCHNLGLTDNSQQYETISCDRIERYLLEHRDFIDGICLTGGEPALHKGRGLVEFLRKIKDNGFEIKFDSNGTDPDLLEELSRGRLVDYFAVDVKAPLDERYYKLAGVETDLEKIGRSLEVVRNSGVGYEFRTTVVPTLLDGKDLLDIAGTIAGAEKFVLQRFVPANCRDRALRNVKAYTREELGGMVEACKKFVDNTRLRGI